MLTSKNVHRSVIEQIKSLVIPDDLKWDVLLAMTILWQFVEHMNFGEANEFDGLWKITI